MQNLYKHSASYRKLLFFVLITFLTPIASYAKDVTFQWTANPAPLNGYKLYYKTGERGTPPFDGTGLNQGTSPILLGKVTTYTVTGLSADETYHFTLTAYNDLGESGFTEVVTVLPDSSQKPVIIKITVE